MSVSIALGVFSKAGPLDPSSYKKVRCKSEEDGWVEGLRIISNTMMSSLAWIGAIARAARGSARLEVVTTIVSMPGVCES